MNVFLEFPTHFMETPSHWSSCCVLLLVFLTAVSKACQPPSSPQCFKAVESESVYVCEWSMNTTESDATFDIYFNKKVFKGYKTTWCNFNEEELITLRPVNISVKAHIGNTSCQSSNRTVVLGHTVKYVAPQNVSMSRLKTNLSLVWNAAESHPALVEVWFRRDQRPTEPWQRRFQNTTNNTSLYQVAVVNLLKDSVYEVQLRQRSTMAKNPLWSEWSSVLIVPAELEDKPEVFMTTSKNLNLNGSRMVKLKWKPMPHATAVQGVEYVLQDTASSHGCPCVKRHTYTKKDTYTFYLSYSAANITVIARNPVSYSPPAIIQVPAEPGADLKACDKMLMDNLIKNNVYKKSCHEWFELKEQDAKPDNVITLKKKKKPQERLKLLDSIKDYVRYVYFEHRCNKAKPQTVQMCSFYRKEGVPNREPQDFIGISETPTSVNLSWQAIPFVNQRGYLKHYKLCSIKLSQQNESKECYNISTSKSAFKLDTLTPGSRYNISLAGVTEAGEGVKATVTINTLPEKPVNVWWSLSLLVAFFLISTQCTFILKRVKNKLFPPVPTPIIPDFNASQLETQEELQEGKEEVHELKLEKLHPEISEDSEITPLRGKWDDGTEEDGSRTSRMSGDDESSGSSDESQGSCRDRDTTDLEQVDNEIALLIYRNGLVFDLRTDSS